MRKERRGNFRSAPQEGLEVRLTTPGHAGSQDERHNLAARLLDVSAKGVCVVTFDKVAKGAPMAVELFIPGRDLRFATKATVSWAASLDKEGRPMHVAGLSFSKVFKADRSVRVEREREELPPEATPSPSPSTTRILPTRGPEPQRGHKRFTPDEVTLVLFQRGFLRSIGLASNAARRLKDLSRSGAQISCAGRLKAGQRVDLRLEFRRAKVSLQIEAVVRWCKRDTTSLEPRYLVGVSFENLPEATERNLRTIEGFFLGF